MKQDFVLDPYLALYLPLYKLDGATIMDESAYGHLCTVTGALWRPDGHYFDGTNDKIDCGNPSILQLERTDSFTFLAWVKTSVTGNQRIIYKANAASPYTGIWCGTGAAGKFYLQLYDDGVGGAASIGQQTDGTVDDDEWHFVAVSYAGTSANSGIITYLEGAVAAQTTFSQGTFDASILYAASMFVGYDAIPTTWTGSIGEVLIYKRVLTPAEIQNIYLSTRWRYR